MRDKSNYKMNTKLAGYDETVVCPYNSSHIILKERIQTHLVKCARSHPNIKLDTCPFNVTHRYRPEHKAVSQFSLFKQLYLCITKLCSSCFKQRHLEECTSRESFDRYAFEIENGPSSSQSGANKFVKPRAPPPQIQNDEEENWDHVCIIVNGFFKLYLKHRLYIFCSLFICSTMRRHIIRKNTLQMPKFYVIPPSWRHQSVANLLTTSGSGWVNWIAGNHKTNALNYLIYITIKMINI